MTVTGPLLSTLLLASLACAPPGDAAEAAPPPAVAVDESLPLAEPATPVRAPTVEDGPARARLLVPTEALVAGTSTTLALRLDLDEGWHVYGRAQNDTGLPVEVALELPAGWRADSPPLWPPAERYVSPGPFVDHVYHDGLTLLLPIRLPADARLGPDRIELQADWLVCEELCMPGSAALSLDVEVVAAGQRAPRRAADATLIDAARASLPGALPADARLTRDGDVLLLRVPGATRLEFHPDVDGLALADIAERCLADGERLRLALAPRLPGGDRLQGVLAVQRDADEPVTHHLVDLAPPGA